MKIKIKSNERNLTIPLPMWVITSGIRITAFVGKKEAKKCLNENNEFSINEAKIEVNEKKKNKNKDYLNYIDMIDYKVLVAAMKELKKYKGLKLVEVHASSGEEVVITV